MTLALATGWIPAVIANLPVRFRAACHWVLYVRSMIGDEGMPSTAIPANAHPAQKLALAKLSIEIDNARKVLYPEDDDV